MSLDEGREFANDVRQNEGKIICDGSFKHGRSSAAFLPITRHTITQHAAPLTGFLGTNIVPGRSADQSAYRGEMGEILGSILTVKVLCKNFGVDTGTVTIGCDCEGAINACEGNRSVSCHWKCYDIVCRIKHKLDNLSITFLFKHTDGHQDAVKPFETLTIWEQANYWADKYAKDALCNYVTDRCPAIPTTIGEGDTWLLTLDAVPVTSEIKKTIYNSKWTDKGKSFWMVRLQIRHDQIDLIE